MLLAQHNYIFEIRVHIHRYFSIYGEVKRTFFNDNILQFSAIRDGLDYSNQFLLLTEIQLHIYTKFHI